MTLLTPPRPIHPRAVPPEALEGDKIRPGHPLFGLVWINPARVSGTPCFYGTRVPIKTLFDWVIGGEPLDAFLDAFEGVEREQAEALLEVAGSGLMADLGRSVKLLLDHNVPRPLRPLLAGHDVSTTRERGWELLGNGTLLAVAATDGFDAVLTADQNLRRQQNLKTLPLAVVVLVATTNRLADLEPLVPMVLDYLTRLKPNRLCEIEAPDRIEIIVS